MRTLPAPAAPGATGRPRPSRPPPSRQATPRARPASRGEAAPRAPAKRPRRPRPARRRVARHRRVRPYLVENSPSRPIWEDKQPQAKLVLRSVMTREPLVSYSPDFLLFAGPARLSLFAPATGQRPAARRRAGGHRPPAARPPRPPTGQAPARPGTGQGGTDPTKRFLALFRARVNILDCEIQKVSHTNKVQKLLLF